jgi:hypothetical protein
MIADQHTPVRALFAQHPKTRLDEPGADAAPLQ